jgi:hypothetical protein
LLRIGNGHFRHLAEQQPLNRSQQTLYIELATKKVKVQNDPHGVAAPYIGEVDRRSFFPLFCIGKGTADPERSSPTYYTSIDACSAKNVLKGVSSIIPSYRGVRPPNPLIFGISLVIFSLHVYGCISAQKKHIITLYSSKSASQ